MIMTMLLVYALTVVYLNFSDLFLLFLIMFICMYLHVGMSICVVSSEAKGIKSSKAGDTKVMNHLTWVLKNELRFAGRTASTLSHGGIFPAVKMVITQAAALCILWLHCHLSLTFVCIFVDSVLLYSQSQLQILKPSM